MTSTTNRNARGSVTDRRARREWLVMTFRANQDLRIDKVTIDGEEFDLPTGVWHGDGEPACRCYRCGKLLTVDTVTPDRIIPGCQGGTYRRNNIRPACGPCNSSTGGTLGNARRRTPTEGQRRAMRRDAAAALSVTRPADLLVNKVCD